MPDNVVKASSSSISKHKSPRVVYYLMLFAATIIWGSSFVFMKDAVDVFAPSTLIGIRFTGATILVGVFFFPRIARALANDAKDYLRVGLIVGVFYFLGYWVQTIGLTDTTPGKNAFLTAAYCVMVPFTFWMVSRKRPNAMHVCMALLCFVGIGFVSLDGMSGMSFGDAMTLLSAVMFALQITFIAFFSRGRDIYAITFIQFAVCGIAGLAIGLTTEPQPALVDITPGMFAQIAYLTIAASFLACLFQNVGQAKVEATSAALILSLESVFGVLFSVVLYGEMLTPRLILGFCIIFIAIIVNETLADKELPWQRKKAQTTSSSLECPERENPPSA